MYYSILSICIGASLGALSRWLLGNALNAFFPLMPPGTLAANLIGSFLIGVSITFFASLPELSPAWRLLVITGFLGSLTTFSTFSAEVTILLKEGEVMWGCIVIATHVLGCLFMTLLGMLSLTLLKTIK
ncbi:fluoride efflux transporter CrcB [Oxalobacter vibrioformis]|uniref:Fluoride-specific ion channel FluC n=1 Tax=Oxalobacter vibrioformis TaxID=933080 RepID=A0A9E9P2N0_9BURK|nr:fluoride efflux transporter CrcB [Oxalobacter vibrioformis]WAW10077.1 fluoride efflux transporter CrcB [Oxalobacter vibrioformis]